VILMKVNNVEIVTDKDGKMMKKKCTKCGLETIHIDCNHDWKIMETTQIKPTLKED